jgi:hypothetical protein
LLPTGFERPCRRKSSTKSLSADILHQSPRLLFANRTNKKVLADEQEVTKMKRTILVVLTILALSAGVFAQTATDEIEKALLPAPRNMKEAATVIKWKPDFTYETLRKGTNRMVCYDRSGQPGQQPFAVECTSIANLERVAQSLKIEAIPDQKERRAAFEAAEKAGAWAKPEFGSLWIHLSGPSQAQARTHVTIAVPGATTQSLGLPEDASKGGVWIMNAGTSAAHIMTPGS